jgi:hypothetical protein
LEAAHGLNRGLLFSYFYHIWLRRKIKGLDFEAYQPSTIFDDDGLPKRAVHINHLIEAKKAAGRLKDLDDIKTTSKKEKIKPHFTFTSTT